MGVDCQLNDNEFDEIIFSLDIHIFGLCWSVPEINFTGWISIEKSTRLSDDLSQNILSDDQITHSSQKSRIKSCFPSSLFLNIQLTIQNIYEFDDNVTRLK